MQNFLLLKRKIKNKKLKVQINSKKYKKIIKYISHLCRVRNLFNLIQ